MLESPDVITAVAEAPAPPDDFTEYQAFRRAKASGEQAKTSEAAVEPPKDAPVEGVSEKVEETPAETAEESEPEEEEKQEEGEPEPGGQPKKKGGYQKKISKLTRRSYELEGEIATLREQLAAKAAEKAPVEAAKPATAEADPEPSVDSDKYQNEDDPYGAWMKDWARWDRRQESAKEAETRRRTEAEANFHTQKQAWSGKLAEAKATHEDYDDKMSDVADVQLPIYVDQAIFESEHGPELAYWLADHRTELERIVKLQPLAAARELGKIEALLTKEPVSGTKPKTAAPAPKVTNAPKPITPVGGGTSGGTPNIVDVANDFTAYARLRREQARDR